MDTYAVNGLNNLAAEVHRIAFEHGWWDKSPSFSDIAVMVHSEISEAVEEYRNSCPAVYVLRGNPDTECFEDIAVTDMDLWKPNEKPEGTAVEMADALIRILDWFSAMGYDAEAIVHAKCAYNERRPYRHGGKAL